MLLLINYYYYVLCSTTVVFDVIQFYIFKNNFFYPSSPVEGAELSTMIKQH